jgi:hypothetical protein
MVLVVLLSSNMHIVSSWGNLSYFCCTHTYAHIILLGTISSHTSGIITENSFFSVSIFCACIGN